MRAFRSPKNLMDAMLSHPWLNDPDVLPRVRRWIQVQVKSIEEMLSSDDPPKGVVLLNRMGLWHHQRIRVVIHEYATIDYEPAFEQPPKTWMLEDADYEHITALLDEVTPETFRSVNMEVLDGDFCALTVVRQRPKWLAYAEVNLAGLPSGEQAAVARLARRLIAIAQLSSNAEHIPSSPPLE